MTLRLGSARKQKRRPRPQRFRVPSEKDVQADIRELFESVGAKVRPMSQYRASHVAAGIPDLVVHHPRAGLSWWFECKSYQALWVDANGITVAFHPFDRNTWNPKPLSVKQRAFQADAVACRERFYWGGKPQAEAALLDLGLAIQRDGQFVLTPRGQAA